MSKTISIPRAALSALALAASFSLAVNAQAAVVQSTAAVWDFKYTLVDLDPNDGVDASISFELYSTGNVTRLGDTSAQQWQGGTATVLVPGSNELVNTQRELNTAYTGAVGLTSAGSGLGKLTGSVAQSNGHAVGASTAIDGANTYYSSSFILSGLSSFTVSQNTIVVFSASAFASATTSGLPVNVDGSSNYANAEAYLELYGPNQSAKMGQYAWASADTANNSASGRIAVSFFNFSNAASQGSIYARALSEGSVAVTAAVVPEPSSYALMLAGLCAVGAIVRRRSAR